MARPGTFTAAIVTVAELNALGRVYTSGTRPTGADLYEGLEIYETDTNRMVTYTGAGWIRTNYFDATGRTGVTISRSTNQSIPNNTVTGVSFTTEGFDSDTMFAPTAATFTVNASQAGLWSLSTLVTWGSGPGTASWVSILINGVNYIGVPAGNSPMAMSLVLPVPASAVIGVNVYQNTGGAINVSAAQLDAYRISV